VKDACLHAHRPAFDVALRCRILGGSRAGFYAAQQRQRSERAGAEARLRLEMRAIYPQSHQRYGSPRVHAERKAHGMRWGKKRVERLRRAEGLRAKQRRRFRTTTHSRHRHPIAPNVLQRRFGVQESEGVDRVWVGDIPYVPTREGWLYLAVVLDLATRRVVGWAMKATLTGGLATDALQMALWSRSPEPGLLHHSDRGVPYACTAYQALLSAHGMTPSMSRRGDCWDHAVAERFFATLEREVRDGSDWHTRQEARRASFAYMEIWSNRQRTHSSLGSKSPAEYEAALALTRRAA
jgi:putative transposase